MSTHINILHVEDFEGDAFLFSNHLEDIDDGVTYIVDWVSTIKDAQIKFDNKKYNICFIDHALPEISGVELVANNKEVLSNTPCILLTGSDSRNVIDESIQAGFSGYLLKNEITASLLKRTINYAIHSKATALALQREKDFASFIVANTPDIILSVSEKGIIKSCSDTIKTHLGYNPSFVIGKNWNTFFSTSQYNVDFKDIDPNHSIAILDKNKKDCFFEWNVLERTYDVNANTQANNKEYILVGKNITKRIVFEKEKRQHDKMEALGQLAGGMAHEISNYMQPIIFAAEIIKIKTPPSEHGYLDIIMRNTLAARDVLKDILTFSRSEKKNPDAVDILPALNSAIDFSARLLPKSFTVNKEGFEDTRFYTAHVASNDLIIIISNILMNAAQATAQKGTVTLGYETTHLDKKQALEKSLSDGHYAVITIADNGPGIDKNNIEHIFQPFFTTKDIGEGTGLGLSMAYGIVTQWGGIIEVKNQNQSGALFTIYIPITPVTEKDP